MASAHDVAKYILAQKGKMDTWKLQKLVYYFQAWHRVWEDQELFPERIEAWANGPVVPALFQVHRQQFEIESWPRGSVARLTDSERESIDVVLRAYGKRTSYALRELSHGEPPWKEARKGVPPGAPSRKVIKTDAMAAYYGSL